MRVVVHSEVAEFARLAGPFLEQREAAYCLPLGIIDTLLSDPTRYAKAWLLSVQDGARLVGIAWMTPPHPLGITDLPLEAVATLTEFCRTLEDSVTAVVGPRPAVDRLKEHWLAATQVSLASSIHQGIYQLQRVQPPPRVSGGMRFANADDRELLTEWSHRFAVDCRIPTSAQEARASAEAALRQGNRVFWENAGEPVAMAGFGGKTPSGMRVSYVYTPPEQRGRGFASALVAALSQHLLEQGHRFCFLYTDLSNPTSNRIYQRLGYDFVCEAAHYTFGNA